MRSEVSVLVGKGPLVGSKRDVQEIDEWYQAFEKIAPPISEEEAKALIGLFPATKDDCFGLAWALLHLVETCPLWPPQECLHDIQNPWIARLRQRILNKERFEGTSRP